LPTQLLLTDFAIAIAIANANQINIVHRHRSSPTPINIDYWIASLAATKTIGSTSDEMSPVIE